MEKRKPYFVITLVSCGLLGAAIHNYLSSPEQNVSSVEVVSQQADSQKTPNETAYSQAAQISTSKVKKAVAAQKPSENYNYIQERLDIMHERRPNAVYDPKEVAAAVARTDAWAPLKEIPQDLPLKKEDLADGREFIKFDSLKVETLVPGDNLHLAIQDNGQQYDVNIDDVEVVDENRTTWRGHIEGTDGHNYEVSLTRGPNLTVGGIDTPDGLYVIQAHGDKGWVASSGLLFKKHADPIDPRDVIAAEGHQHDH